MPMPKDTRWSIIAVLCTSIIGGAFGTYVSFKLLEQRVVSVELRVAVHDQEIKDNRKLSDGSIRDLTKLIGEVNSSVQYIRGRIENMPASTQERK